MNYISQGVSEIGECYQVTCRVYALDLFLIDSCSRLLVIKHLQKAEVLHRCRSLLRISFRMKNDPLKVYFILGCMGIPKGVHGLSDACFRTKTGSEGMS
jgi:hypothetical protein